jgi:NDP-sugar pyrophosphorylase family protein
MLNVLIPLGGKPQFFDSEEYRYPKPLVEIHGKTMIEWVVENVASAGNDVRYIFVVNKADCQKFHLDAVLRLITQGHCEIIISSGETKGAVCSSLMAIEFIQNDDPLVILNGDQIIDADFNQIMTDFQKRNLDAGVITFESVHPKWSFVRLDVNQNIVETAEKRPISNNAIAGFYYYKKGSDFVMAAMLSIEKDANVNGMYYVAPTMNELVLANKKLGIYKIANSQYHSFYSPQKIKEFESKTHMERQ